MNPARFIRSRATALWRALSVLVVVAGAVTCDSPTSLGHRVALSVAPVFGKLSMSGFSGLTVDSVRLTVVRPPSDTVSQQTFAFSPDSASISANITVNLVSSHEQLVVLIAFLSNSQVVFSGVDTVDVVAGSTTPPTASVPISYVGPGQSVTTLHITPRDSGATFGATVPFVITATDSSNANVPSFYVHWSTSRTGDTINAAGMFRPAAVRGLAWVRARTPTGIWDSARIAVVPVPNSIVKLSGDAQAGPVSTALAQPLVVRVFAADNLPVVGTPVQFAAVTGGGSVGTALVATDTSGRASTIATLGASLGAATFSATIQGTSLTVTFVDTALNAHGVPTAIAKVSGDSQTTLIGTAVSFAPKVKVTDAFNAPVVGASVTFAVQAGGGSVTGGTQLTDANGFAQVGSWIVGPTPGTNTLNASIPAAPSVPAVAFGARAKGTLFVSVLGSGVAGVGRAGALVVKVGAPDVITDTVFVSSDSTAYLTIAAPKFVIFAPGDTLKTIQDSGIAAGTTIVRADAPVRFISGTVTVPVTTNVISLPASVSVAAGGTTPVAVTLSSPAPGGGVVVGLTSTDTTKARFTTPTVTVPASSTSVNATVQGVAQGSAVLVATSATYAPTSAPVTVTSGGGVATTTVTPKFDTLTSLTDSVLLSAQAKNNLGANVTGSFTWTSRNPALVTVSAAGYAKAVANGSTFVVATETGGTQDSALVTVQQRLATINVTPGTRNIYLTRNFTFSAVAVDGKGFAMPGVTTFNWTTTAPAVASVDTSIHTASTSVLATGLGTAQVKATSGTVIGVANVSVLTPITRIAVVVDTVGAFKTDTFTLTSLGLTRQYRAIAHDTLNAVMTGVTFTWASTNGSVALDSTTGTATSTATSAANGVTTINATAQGFTSAPGALLTVAQVLASIELKPDTNNPTATIGVGGTMHVSARGKDANSRYISGGTFIYQSGTPGIATVDSVTGLVTGVAQGGDTVSATSGAITSNKVLVTVSNGGPAIISFGRDTLSVGRGNSQAYPVLLSKPAGAPLIVKLTAPAFAHWQTPTVTIPQGQTSINATLVGDSAGTTTVTATDSSGLGYSGASAVAKITANMRLTSGGYAIMTNDIVSTQVLLSDPSPAGGTYVTFNYSTPGIASVSPDPAFIPQGQLAADIQIHAIGAGSTNITPSAIGVNGASSGFTAYPAVLLRSTGFIRLGQGQYEPSDYVYTQANVSVPVPVTITSTDTTLVSVAPTVATISSGLNYAYFNTTANGIGSATLSFSAPGWTASGTIAVVSTTPYVGVCCGTTLNTTSPQQGITVYSEDSLRNAHYRVNSLVVRLHSTDTTVIRVIDTVVTIQPGLYYNNSGHLVPSGVGGTAYVVATASGHQPDSTLYTVVGPKLQFSWFSARLGAGQLDYNQYIYTPDNVAAPLVVNVANSDSTAVTVPSADTIPQGTNYRYFNVLANAPGSATFIASAGAGYQPDTAFYQITTPRVAPCCNYSFNNFDPNGANLTVYSEDSVGTAHYRRSPLTVTITSLDTNVIKLDSATVTIDSGIYYNNRAHMTPVGVGVGRIVISAPGHTSIDTTFITVQTPKLSFSFYTAMLGQRQHFSPDTTGLYVYTPNARGVPVSVTITQKHIAYDTLTRTSPTIPAGTNYVYLDAFGLSNGVDTLIASATGYIPDTAFITVTTPRLANSGIPGSATTTNPPFGLNVYATDSLGSGHYITDSALVIAAVSSDTLQIKPAQPSFRILKNAYYASTTVNITGPTGTSPAASMTYSDSAATGYTPTTTNTITITGPSLFLSRSSFVLGMRQSDGTNSDYVYTQNNVVSPLVVHLLSTSTRVATVPDSVIILAGNNYAYFQVVAQDTVGTIQIQATATGYGPKSMNVQVTQPRFGISTSTPLNTTASRTGITVYAEDANNNAHYPTLPVIVQLNSSAGTVASIDSAFVTIPTTQYYTSVATWSPGVVGTSQLTATDTSSTFYKYNQGSANVTVVTPNLNISSAPGALGLGQYVDYVYPYTPDYAKTAISVAFTHTGTARTGTFTNLTNTPIAGVTIDSGTNYKYYRMSGLVRGTDSLTASIASPLHNPATIYTVVDSGRVDPLQGWPGSITTASSDSTLITLYARDPNTNARTVVGATTFALLPSANIVFYQGGAPVTQVTIPADQQSVPFYLKGLSPGTGSVTITNSNYKTYTNTVTVTP